MLPHKSDCCAHGAAGSEKGRYFLLTKAIPIAEACEALQVAGVMNAATPELARCIRCAVPQVRTEHFLVNESCAD